MFILKLTKQELAQLRAEFLALANQGCLDKAYCEAMELEYDPQYVKNFNSIYNKLFNCSDKGEIK